MLNRGVSACATIGSGGCWKGGGVGEAWGGSGGSGGSLGGTCVTVNEGDSPHSTCLERLSETTVAAADD